MANRVKRGNAIIGSLFFFSFYLHQWRSALGPLFLRLTSWGHQRDQSLLLLAVEMVSLILWGVVTTASVSPWMALETCLDQALAIQGTNEHVMRAWSSSLWHSCGTFPPLLGGTARWPFVGKFIFHTAGNWNDWADRRRVLLAVAYVSLDSDLA